MIDKLQIVSFIILDPQDLNVRCFNCGWLLAKRLKLSEGHIEIKCQKCGRINKIIFS